MSTKELIEQYLHALEQGNLDEMLSLFDEQAIVVSPLYGKVSANHFYKELFSDTSQSQITLLNTFPSNENENVCAGHFRYDWTMKDGTLVSFECVDIFQTTNENKFEQLTIIYDTQTVRGEFYKLKAN
ncbi:nuclear transport factor 2 family protein [Bacillus sp. 03113]|uniref:nuclear transport factor 2 family protein n=1 Tax=Bacillus sp. 03113 TaxID=2578211 RepID=UPI0011413A77|nr:nuclear transport factor 2 family protein [Bacillus sp. 03113]